MPAVLRATVYSPISLLSTVLKGLDRLIFCKIIPHISRLLKINLSRTFDTIDNNEVGL